MFRAATASAPAASSPAPSASSRPRAASRAVPRRGSLPGPRSRRASQPPAGTIGTRAAAGVRPAAIPPSAHRMPRGEAADRIITGTTLGEHDRLRGPFGDNADTRCPYRRDTLLFVRYGTCCPRVTSPDQRDKRQVDVFRPAPARCIDSAGLAAPVGTAKRAAAHGGSLYAVCARPKNRQLFRVTGLDCWIPLARTMDEALEALAAVRATF